LKTSKEVEGKEMKNNILQSKEMSLDEQIAQEQQTEEKIKLVTPAKTVSSGTKHDDLLRNCSTLLKNFDEEAESNENIPPRAKLWNGIKNQISCVPNIMIFSVLKSQLDTHISSIIHVTSVLDKDDTSNKKDLLRLQKNHLVKAIGCRAQKEEHLKLKAACAKDVQSLENELEKMLGTTIDYSYQYEEEDIVSDFVSVMLKRLDCQGKIDYCNTLIASMKQQIEKDRQIGMGYQSLIHDTRNVYSIVEERVANMQESIAQLHQIKEKINFTKLSMMRLVQELKSSHSQQLNRTLMNQTLTNASIQSQPAATVSSMNCKLFCKFQLRNLAVNFMALTCPSNT